MPIAGHHTVAQSQPKKHYRCPAIQRYSNVSHCILGTHDAIQTCFLRTTSTLKLNNQQHVWYELSTMYVLQVFMRTTEKKSARQETEGTKCLSLYTLPVVRAKVSKTVRKVVNGNTTGKRFIIDTHCMPIANYHTVAQPQPTQSTGTRHSNVSHCILGTHI